MLQDMLKSCLFNFSPSYILFQAKISIPLTITSMHCANQARKLKILLPDNYSVVEYIKICEIQCFHMHVVLLRTTYTSGISSLLNNF